MVTAANFLKTPFLPHFVASANLAVQLYCTSSGDINTSLSLNPLFCAVVVQVRVGKAFPDTKQNVRKIELIKGKGGCKNSGPTCW